MKAERINTVVVVGGGTMGQGIVQNFAEAGLSVRLVELTDEILNRCLMQVNANLRLFQEYGLLREDIPMIESRIQPFMTKDLDTALQGCDFVVEAIPEVLELKRELFIKLDTCPDNVILSSNTSRIITSEIAQGCRNKGRIIGLHYYNPAHIMPLVEIHYSPETSDATIETTRDLMLRVGKRPITVKRELPGFVINRLQAAIGREINYLVDQGVVSPEDIETAGKAGLGFRWACIGYMESMDMVGLDIITSGNSINATLYNGTEPSRTLKEKVSRGELGLKTGKGLLDYYGKTREQVLDDYNRRLLRQLSVFRELEKK